MKKDLALVNENSRFGPAMQALTANQRAFVLAYISLGGRKQTEAYLMAYPNCGGANQAKANASGMMHSDHILAAVREEADRQLRAGALLGSSVLIEIASDPMNKNQFKAAIELLNRAGMIVATRHEVEVTDKRTDDEILTRIALIANKLGLDPAKLIGQDTKVPVVEDAEYVEISNEGLEDVL